MDIITDYMVFTSTSTGTPMTRSCTAVSVAGVDFPVADDMKMLCIVLDLRFTFHQHVSVVARSYNICHRGTFMDLIIRLYCVTLKLGRYSTVRDGPMITKER